jgi:hypothetical protein
MSMKDSKIWKNDRYDLDFNAINLFTDVLEKKSF